MTRRYEKPAILSAFPAAGPVTIEASAGTGKTYTLEHLIIELLLGDDGVEIDNILVVTFTEKATDELRARVRGLMERLITGAHDDAADGAPTWTIDDAAKAKLRAQVRRFDRAAIHTIHGFCQRLLTEHAFANQRLFGQTVVDGRRAFRRTFNELLRRRWAKEPVLRRLLGTWLATDKQLSTLEQALFHCIERRTPIVNAMPLDEWNTRFDALAAWVKSEVPASLAEKTGRLKPATARKIKKCFATWPDLGESELLEVVKKDIGTSKTKANFFEAVRGLPVEGAAEAALILQAASEARSALTATLYAAFLPMASEAFYHDKAAHGQMDFDDMLRIVCETVQRDPGGVAPSAIRAQYRYALIDEFQDTDDVQWRIFSTLFPPDGPEATGASANRLITVGDPKQAIYGFRGADVYTYLNAKHAIERHGAQLVLDTNYRSSPEVIRGVNELLDQRADSPFFPRDHEIRYDHPVAGDPRREAKGPSKDAAAIHLWRFDVNVERGEGATAHARRIAAEATQLIADGAVGDAADIFVLVRTAREGQMVGDALTTAGVPYGFVRQESLFEAGEAGAVLDLLLAVVDPFDRSRRYKAWLTPFFGVELRDLGRLADADADHPLFRRLLGWHELARRKRYDLLFPAILDESGFRRRALFSDPAGRMLIDVEHIVELLEDEAGRRAVSLGELCDELEAWIEKRAVPTSGDALLQRVDQRAGAVQILTMHMSKGLEADVVFVFGGLGAGMGDRHGVNVYHEHEGDVLVARAHAGRLVAAPSLVKERVNAEREDEDRRLLYVTMTRARERLYLPVFTGDTVQSRGCYAPLNSRLNAMLRAGLSDAFAVEDVDVDIESPSLPVAVDLGDWAPGALATGRRFEFEAARADAAPLVVSSYSRMKRAGRARFGDGVAWTEGLEVDRADAAIGLDVDASSQASEDALPGGANTGSFLHDVLETLPLASARGLDTEAWRASPDVIETVTAAMRAYEIDARHLNKALDVVWRALTATLTLGDSALPGVCSLDHTTREMPFLFPIPEGSPRPRRTLARQEKCEVDRGFVKGYVDLAFEHGGKVYLADWKADVLADYEPATLHAHVEAHYDIQWRLYTSAAVRWLGITSEREYAERFGGFVYLFLRGLEAPPAAGRDGGEQRGGDRGGGERSDRHRGVCYVRPTWDAVMAYEATLRDPRKVYA